MKRSYIDAIDEKFMSERSLSAVRGFVLAATFLVVQTFISIRPAR